jgi:hypothetical protein
MADGPDNPYTSPQAAPKGRPLAQKHLKWSLIYAVGGNVAVILIFCVLFRHRQGEAVRPMDLTCLEFMIVVFTPILVVPRARAAYPAERSFGPLLAMVLAFTPFFVGMAAMHLIGNLLDLSFKP